MTWPLSALSGAALLATRVLAAGIETSQHFAINGRTTVDDCFGPNGICTIWDDDFDPPCEDALGNNFNYTAWAICHCGTGWLSMLQACDDCKKAMNLLSSAITESYYSSTCTSSGLSIAPIPSSVLSRLSQASISLVVTTHQTNSATPRSSATLFATSTPPISGNRKTTSSYSDPYTAIAPFTTTLRSDPTTTGLPPPGIGLPGSPNGSERVLGSGLSALAVCLMAASLGWTMDVFGVN